MPAHLKLAACLAALSFAAAAPAMAQPSGPPSQGGQGGQRPDLAAMLHLSPSQQGAYQAWQTARRPTPEQQAQLHATSPQTLASLPTPQRLDRIDQFLNVQMDIFHRQAAATRTFYSQLSPAQRQTFDQVTGPQQPQGSQQRPQQ